ncbi:hypothetical protein M1145_02615 [Patescibacteria group bacterium]|nr:hypothetical protein [Patescibacteria group bacterium]
MKKIDEQEILKSLALEGVLVEHSIGFLRELSVITEGKDDVSLKILPLENPSYCVDITPHSFNLE